MEENVMKYNKGDEYATSFKLSEYKEQPYPPITPYKITPCPHLEGEWGNGGLFLPHVGMLTPGISGFYFKFKDPDHHIKCIATGHLFDFFPPYNGQFVTSHAVLNFTDNSDSRPYEYRLFESDLPKDTVFGGAICRPTVGAAIRKYQTGDVNYNYEPVIAGFLFSKNEDTHIKSLGYQLEPAEDAYFIYFRDKKPDEAVDFWVSYAMVKSTHVYCKGSVTGKARGSAYREISASHPFLQGFNLRFTNDDHHIQEVGVILKPGKMNVYFNDKNDDDEFEYTIQYLDLIM